MSQQVFPTVLLSMITIGLIRNGANYLSHHLRKNDYWAEGEKEVHGEWIGEGAKALGLEGIVSDKAFDALRQNRHPKTGEPLTARDSANRVAFFDIQLSAPKDVSVLAIVGGDDRLREAFAESVKTVLVEMERFAAVRERRGEAAMTEEIRLTGNFVGAMFVHDASRDLDPQLHAHAVLANATDPFTKSFLEQMKLGGQVLGLEIQIIMLNGQNELEAAFASIKKQEADAVIVQPSLPRSRVADLALKHLLPAIAPTAAFAAEGGLAAYAANQIEMARRTVATIDKILKGSKPADLPVEQPTKFQLVINLKTAKALGLAVPPTLLARADEVIE